MIVKRIAVVGCDAVGCQATCHAALKAGRHYPETLPGGWIQKDGAHACPIHRADLEEIAERPQTKKSMLATALLRQGWPENRLPSGWLKVEASRIGMTIGYANDRLAQWDRRQDWFAGYAAEQVRLFPIAEKGL